MYVIHLNLYRQDDIITRTMPQLPETLHSEPKPAQLPFETVMQFSTYYPSFSDGTQKYLPTDMSEYNPMLDMIEVVNQKNLPKPARNEFTMFAQKHSDNPNTHVNQLENFNAFFVIPHKKQTYNTWVGWHTKLSMDNWHFKSNFYLCDLTENNEVIGQSHVSYTMMSSDPFYHNPSEHWNGTEFPFVGNGYGTNRLLMMNALSLTFWGLPMRSDLYLMGKAEGHKTTEELLWKKFVRQGIAKTYTLKQNLHYIFIPEMIATH